MAGPFRPAGGPNSASAVLAELARLWDQAEHRAAGRGERLTQKRLAGLSRVPLTTVNSWATGTSLPRDLDRLTAVAAVLARWAGEDPPGERDWEQLLRTDLAARAVLDEGGRKGAPVGWPVAEVTDPFALEVHRPVQPEDAPPGLPILPLYVRREHDQVLDQVVRAAAEGRSGIAVLVGGSSTGKTRACWEALQLLRDRPESWWLWHPIDPSRPDAALRELPVIGPRTVVWLNEAQFYLETADGGLGERVAAGLRELLRDPGRAPVLVLVTVWPRFWDTLTARPVGSDDRHAQARELLAGHDIIVPATFTPAQMDPLTEVADVRMVLAARSAPDGEVIQFLAGAPELLSQYRNAPPAAAALIHAAMDARRLGMGAGLPQAFLEAAAPGYLTDAEWDELGEDWLEQALAYTAKQCKGARGPLTRIRPRPVRSAARNRGDQPGSTGTAAGPLYWLADYLDQHGRAHRSGQIPPVEFWSAAAAHAAPGDQAALGGAAHARGLYRDAAQLHKNAAVSGNLLAVRYLSDPPLCLRADPRPAHWAAAHAALDDPDAVARLLDSLREAGAHQQVAVLADRAAARAPVGDPAAVARLLDRLREAGAHQQAAVLADRAAARAPVGDPAAVAHLLGSLREAGAPEQVATLLARDPAAHAVLGDDLFAVGGLVGALWRVGAPEQAAALADRAAAHAPVDNLFALRWLLSRLPIVGAYQQAAALADRAAAHLALDDPGAVAYLLGSLREAGAHQQVATLLARDPARHAVLDDPGAVAHLLGSLREAGAHQQVATLADRAAAHAVLDDADAVAGLLVSLREAGAHQQAAALVDRAAALLGRDRPAHADDDPDGWVIWLADMQKAAVIRLLGSLREAGAPEQVAALADRAAAHVALDDADAVTRLLDSLREAGAPEQVATLLARDPARHAALDNSYDVAWLLDSLREAGAPEQVAALADRAAAHAALDHLGVVAVLLNELHRSAPQQVAALADRVAAHVPVDDPDAVAHLLDSLREAGAHQQVAALADRAAAHAALHDPDAVTRLLDSLREAGAHQQATTLTERLPTAGEFGLAFEQKGLADQFRFGREADGTPAAPWGWEDLDLWLVPRPRGQSASAQH